jgi:hypothetical protein
MLIEVEALPSDHRQRQAQIEGGDVEPDVCWGQHGIDALSWADPPPLYTEPTLETSAASLEPLPGDEAP